MASFRARIIVINRLSALSCRFILFFARTTFSNGFLSGFTRNAISHVFPSLKSSVYRRSVVQLRRKHQGGWHENQASFALKIPSRANAPPSSTTKLKKAGRRLETVFITSADFNESAYSRLDAAVAWRLRDGYRPRQ